MLLFCVVVIFFTFLNKKICNISLFFFCRRTADFISWSIRVKICREISLPHTNRFKQHHSKVLLNSFPTNGHILGVFIWNQKLENLVSPKVLLAIKQLNGLSRNLYLQRDLIKPKVSLAIKQLNGVSRKLYLQRDLICCLRSVSFDHVSCCYARHVYRRIICQEHVVAMVIKLRRQQEKSHDFNFWKRWGMFPKTLRRR